MKLLIIDVSVHFEEEGPDMEPIAGVDDFRSDPDLGLLLADILLALDPMTSPRFPKDDGPSLLLVSWRGSPSIVRDSTLRQSSAKSNHL